MPTGLSRRQLIGGSLLGAGVLALAGAAWRLTAAGEADVPAGLRVLSRREAQALAALSLALFPPGNGFGVDAVEAGVVGYIDKFLARLGDGERRLTRTLIFLFDQATLTSGHLRPARHLEWRTIQSYLKNWESSRLEYRRQLLNALKALIGSAYFEHPRVQAALGISRACGSLGPSLWEHAPI